MTEKDAYKVIDDIKSLKIQGNTNIAKTVAKTLLDYVTHTKVIEFEDFIEKVKDLAVKLSTVRENEPFSLNIVSFLLRDLGKCENQAQVRIKFIERIENFFRYLDDSYEVIRTAGADVLSPYRVIYTHCHSALAREILIRLNSLHGGEFTVINDETRPRFQGRITATKLAEAGVKVIHVVDSAATTMILDDRYLRPDAVLVGCDGITINGDLINKVGTYNIALAAKEAKIPFFVVSQTMKIDLRSIDGELLIEQRDPSEVWEEGQKNIQVLNPSFDFVPAKYITGGYITEKGILKPNDFKDLI